MPDTRPQYGLPYQQLPAATRRDLTPESMLEQETQAGRQQIQNKYALQWKEISRSRRFIGATKATQMLRQIDMKAKQEMLQFNQQAQAQFTQLRNIDRLAQQGAITNPEQIKARMAFGADVARSMYPEPERERSIALQFGELDVYSRRIENRLDQFRRPKKRIKKWYLGEEKEPVRLGKIQIWDINTPGKINKETGKMEYWRNASPEEIQERTLLIREEARISDLKSELLGRPDISRRIVQPDTKGGTFADKVTESIPKSTIRRQQRPKVIRQRNRLTGQVRESRDGGKTWTIIG